MTHSSATRACIAGIVLALTAGLSGQQKSSREKPQTFGVDVSVSIVRADRNGPRQGRQYRARARQRRLHGRRERQAAGDQHCLSRGTAPGCTALGGSRALVDRRRALGRTSGRRDCAHVRRGPGAYRQRRLPRRRQPIRLRGPRRFPAGASSCCCSIPVRCSRRKSTGQSDPRPSSWTNRWRRQTSWR